MNYKHLLKVTVGIFLFFTLTHSITNAQENQGQQMGFSQQFRLGDRIIRVAEPGQLADTLNVWGDVNSPGRYLVPRGTTLPQLISYTFGPQTIRDRESNLDWSKMRVEVNISEYSQQKGQEIVKNFKYRFDEPLPQGMRSFDLENNQVVSIQVKRKPAFIDYVKVIGPVISGVAGTLLILERLR